MRGRGRVGDWKGRGRGLRCSLRVWRVNGKVLSSSPCTCVPCAMYSNSTRPGKICSDGKYSGAPVRLAAVFASSGPGVTADANPASPLAAAPLETTPLRRRVRFEAHSATELHGVCSPVSASAAHSSSKVVCGRSEGSDHWTLWPMSGTVSASLGVMSMAVSASRMMTIGATVAIRSARLCEFSSVSVKSLLVTSASRSAEPP